MKLVNRIKGFSLFELVVVLTIIGVLIAIAIDKLPAWQEQAERSAMQNVAGSLNSAGSAANNFTSKSTGTCINFMDSEGCRASCIFGTRCLLV